VDAGAPVAAGVGTVVRIGVDDSRGDDMTSAQGHGPGAGEHAARTVQQAVDRAAGRPSWGCGSVLLSVAPDQQPHVVAALRVTLRGLVEGAWHRGWQPADIHHVARRRLRSRTARLVDELVVDQLSGYARSTVDPRWWDQVSSRGMDRRAGAPGEPLGLRLGQGRTWEAFASDVAELIVLLVQLPRIEQLGPLPGEHAAQAPVTGGADEVDDKILTRVRRLLAKAESTPYQAEAETFTAGAQALMARHNLDRAMLDRAAKQEEQAARTTAVAVRIALERPYESPKALLLHLVSEANGCRAVWSSDVGLSTVVGHRSDLRAVELLFTSLLLQASSALQRELAAARPAVTRGRAYRSSFLTGFAVRTGERLRAVVGEQARQASEAVDRPDALVHVLATRAADVQAEVQRIFPVTSRATTGSVRDHGAWMQGRAAADLAHWGGASGALPGRGA
jgi:hypothetical protein